MAISNRERQKKFRETRIQTGHSRVACWLGEDDNQRLHRLMEMLNENGQNKVSYSTVISQALKELEIRLTPPEHRNLIRYGLIFMDDRNKHGQ